MIEMKLKTLIFYILLAISLLFFIYPVYFAFNLAFMPRAAIFQLPPNYIFQPTLDNFVKVINSWEFSKYLMNSTIVSILSVSLSLIVGLPATYALVRYDIPKKGTILSMILGIRFLPITSVAIPFYIMFVTLGLYDTMFGLLLTYILLNLPFIVWLMRGYIMDVPTELEESYEVDGLSKTQVFLRITLPLVYKGLLATVLFCFIFTWNEFGIALLLTGTNARTLPVQSLQFVASLGLDWGALCAAAVLIASPMIVFGLLIRRYLIRGLSLGAVR